MNLFHSTNIHQLGQQLPCDRTQVLPSSHVFELCVVSIRHHSNVWHRLWKEILQPDGFGCGMFPGLDGVAVKPMEGHDTGLIVSTRLYPALKCTIRDISYSNTAPPGCPSIVAVVAGSGSYSTIIPCSFRFGIIAVMALVWNWLLL